MACRQRRLLRCRNYRHVSVHVTALSVIATCQALLNCSHVQCLVRSHSCDSDPVSLYCIWHWPRLFILVPVTKRARWVTALTVTHMETKHRKGFSSYACMQLPAMPTVIFLGIGPQSWDTDQDSIEPPVIKISNSRLQKKTSRKLTSLLHIISIVHKKDNIFTDDQIYTPAILMLLMDALCRSAFQSLVICLNPTAV